MYQRATQTGTVINARDVKCTVDDSGIDVRSNRSIWTHSGAQWVRWLQVSAVIGAIVPALTVRHVTDSGVIALVAFLLIALAIAVAAALVDTVAVRRATDKFIPAAAIQRIDDSYFGTTSTFTIQHEHHGGLLQQQIVIDNALGTQMDSNAVREVFRLRGWMHGKCDTCGYMLLPKQMTCPECGATAKGHSQ